MYFEERKRKNGKPTYFAVNRYVDPLTVKAKREVVKFYTNTAHARKQAERDLSESKMVGNLADYGQAANRHTRENGVETH